MEIIDRKSEDNNYLHRDFHLLLNRAIDHIGEKYGEKGVIEYIQNYARCFFSPMTLTELDSYFHKLYQSEDAEKSLHTTLTENALAISVISCPAIAFIRSMGDVPAKYYVHTTSTLYREIADICGFGFVLQSYDVESGAAKFRFEKEERK